VGNFSGYRVITFLCECHHFSKIINFPTHTSRGGNVIPFVLLDSDYNSDSGSTIFIQNHGDLIE
jgi:hypothetical protein